MRPLRGQKIGGGHPPYGKKESDRLRPENGTDTILPGSLTGNPFQTTMIILITGASHTGKTLLAQRLLERYQAPYLSIDHLKMGLIRSGQTSLTPMDDDALTPYLWPIVREIIKTAIENRQNLILEGCYVPFDWRRDFDERYLREIRFICLAMTDAYIEANFREIAGHARDIEARLDDSGCAPDFLKAENRKYIQGFAAQGEGVTLIQGDYAEAIAALLEQP